MSLLQKIPTMKIKKYLIPAASIILSLIALYFSWDANNIARENRQDVRQINKLHLEPIINLRANISNPDGSPPNIILANEGVVRAAFVELKIYDLRYDEKKREIRIALTGSEVNWKLVSMNPKESKAFIIPDHWLNYDYYKELSKVESRPIEHYIIEVYLSYRRESDLRLYQKRSFYFFDHNGRILKENDISNKDKFSNILAAARTSKIDTQSEVMSNKLKTDILHDVQN